MDDACIRYFAGEFYSKVLHAFGFGANFRNMRYIFGTSSGSSPSLPQGITQEPHQTNTYFSAEGHVTKYRSPFEYLLEPFLTRALAPKGMIPNHPTCRPLQLAP